MSSKLIVDFPCRRSWKKTNNSNSKQVQFSDKSTMRAYDPRHEDLGKLFYSENEYQAMKLANQDAIVVIRKNFVGYLQQQSRGNCRSGEMYEDLIEDNIFGNEKFLSAKLARKVMTNRKNRQHAVLAVQARQMAYGYHDPEEISRASKHFSKSDSERSQKIGSLQSCREDQAML